MEWKIGCSGYHYPGWKGIFYPESLAQRKWFEFYSKHFSTLELNVFYYRFPRLEVVQRWRDRSPAGFCFSVKAPQQITHLRKMADARNMVGEFSQLAREGLGEKLGCVLFQFPSSFEYNVENFARLIEMTDLNVRNVFEFRHASWWNPDVYEALKRADIGFCAMSHPQLPNQVVNTTDSLYYRLHGVPHLYSSAYDVPTLERLAQEIIATGSKQSFIYFNNTAEGHAITNARQMQEICELVH